jgi:Domain of unknown function (DUF4760)
VFNNRAIARKRATLDLILHIESDGDLLKARNDFITLKKGHERSNVWGTEDKSDTDQAKTARTVLNINELVAVSIREKVIDEKVFRRWFNRAFISDYQSMTGYIEEVRKYKKNPAIFKELEEISKKWEADSTWYDNPSWLSRKWAALKKVTRA